MIEIYWDGDDTWFEAEVLSFDKVRANPNNPDSSPRHSPNPHLTLPLPLPIRLPLPLPLPLPHPQRLTKVSGLHAVVYLEDGYACDEQLIAGKGVRVNQLRARA